MWEKLDFLCAGEGPSSEGEGGGGSSPPPYLSGKKVKRLLPGRCRRPLVANGSAALEGDRTRRLQEEGERLGRLEQVDDDVHAVDQSLVEELELAGDLVAVLTRKEQRVDA